MSRHLPDCTPTIVLSEVRVHFWLVPPLHDQISIWVPLALLLPVTSRHLPDIGLTSWLAVMAAWASGTSMIVAATATAAVPVTATAGRSLILIGISRARGR